MYIIHDNPNDFPGKFLVMGWTAFPNQLVCDEDPHAVVDTLEEARSKIPFECRIKLERDPADIPSVVETWC